MRYKWFTLARILIVAVALVVTGCSPNATPIPAATPVPTFTAVPTYTPRPTATASSTLAPSTTPTLTQLPTLTPLPTVTPTGTALPAAVLLSDMFVDNRSGWSLGPNSDFDAQINGGHLSVAIKTLNNILLVPVPKSLPADVDVSFEAVVENITSTDTIFGAICRDKKDLNFYLFQINLAKGASAATIFKVINGQISPFGGWQTPKVNPVAQGTNHIRMVCIGDQLQLSVNGTTLAAVKDDSFKDGTVALVSGAMVAGANVAFSNLVIKAPGPNAIQP